MIHFKLMNPGPACYRLIYKSSNKQNTRQHHTSAKRDLLVPFLQFDFPLSFSHFPLYSRKDGNWTL